MSGLHFQVVRHNGNGLAERLSNEGTKGNYHLCSVEWNYLEHSRLHQQCETINEKGNLNNEH